MRVGMLGIFLLSWHKAAVFRAAVPKCEKASLGTELLSEPTNILRVLRFIKTNTGSFLPVAPYALPGI